MKCLLITANVGSLFDATDSLKTGWVKEIVSVFRSSNPSFFAVHFQESGGKLYRENTKYVRSFIENLHEVLCREFGELVGVAFVDEDFDNDEKFTALASLYLIRKHLISDTFLYDFDSCRFQPCASSFSIKNENLDDLDCLRRLKFPQKFFPEFKWTRKGFMYSRWKVKEKIFNVVNVHLFHDACNLTAAEDYPSVYSIYRKNALNYLIDWLRTNYSSFDYPTFLFGDFNFRLDTKSAIKILTNGAIRKEGPARSFLQFMAKSSDETVLTVEQKCFDYHNLDGLTINYAEILDLDKEADSFHDLHECKIGFPPSYPYNESVESPRSFMTTRCPAWCDRVLMNGPAWEIISKNMQIVKYGIIGNDTCMGDHKPVYLLFDLPVEPGPYVPLQPPSTVIRYPSKPKPVPVSSSLDDSSSMTAKQTIFAHHDSPPVKRSPSEVQASSPPKQLRPTDVQVKTSTMGSSVDRPASVTPKLSGSNPTAAGDSSSRSTSTTAATEASSTLKSVVVDL